MVRTKAKDIGEKTGRIREERLMMSFARETVSTRLRLILDSTKSRDSAHDTPSLCRLYCKWGILFLQICPLSGKLCTRQRRDLWDVEGI